MSLYTIKLTLCIMLNFRDNCEELRSTLSQRHQDEVFTERHEQLQMKEEQKKKDAEVDSFYADLWAKDIQIKRMKEEQTAREQIERNLETLKVRCCFLVGISLEDFIFLS